MSADGISIMNIVMLFLVSVYAFALLFIFLYSLAQAHLLIRYLKQRHSKRPEHVPHDESFEPKVTVQLPIYNELYVVERLIDAVAKLDYPKEKLEIQVLDDSTDETIQLISEKVKQWSDKGIDIVQVRRDERTGYKAGALKHGLELAKGDFIAIFDADFVPEPDFIRKTISSFLDENIGMVQTKWDHINRKHSLLTDLQAFGLDAHFSVEQVGRCAGQSFMNFNGTAGIWKKECIIDAGNWSSDTLTEDLDLSYRAQLKNWKFKYLENVSSPSEIPPVMNALKSQQYRWTKGGAETARKHLWNILSSELPITVKFHALFHLLNSFVFICIGLCAITSLPIMLFKEHLPQYELMASLSSGFIFSFIIISAIYFFSNLTREKNLMNGVLGFIKTYPLFLSVSMGLSIHNSIAVLEGYYGKKTPFIRTPKFNLKKENTNWKSNKYFTGKIGVLSLFEGLFALIFGLGTWHAVQVSEYGLIPFYIMLCFGFGTVFYYSLYHSKNA